MVQGAPSWIDQLIVEKYAHIIFSRMKWQPIPTCLVCSWKTGFLERLIADWLSQYIITGPFYCTPKSFNKEINHTISQQQPSIALYFAFIELLATTDYFFDFQLIKDLPNCMQKPLIDLLVSEQLAQSLSEYAINPKFWSGANSKPCPGACFRYLSMYSMCCLQVLRLWLVHVPRKWMCRKTYIRFAECQIQQFPNQMFCIE